jgi:hypothetical protein
MKTSPNERLIIMSGNQTFKEIIVPEGDGGLALAFYVIPTE